MRLLPLGLPSIPARAEALVRGRLAQRQPAADAWIAAHPEEFARQTAAERAHLREALQYTGEDGRTRPFLGDYDSYTWLRAARNVVRSGSPCDAEVDGVCRDTFTLAPLGYESPYARSWHVRAIAAAHRVATWLSPNHPLPASMYLAGVAIALLGVLPAFAIGRRLAGPIGGFFAALVSGLHPVFLLRSLGVDNDGWNVVLPLYAMWAILAALQARRLPRVLLGGACAGVITAGHAAIWRGWELGAAVIAAGLGAALALYALDWLWRRRDWRVWQSPGVVRVASVALGFGLAGGALLPLIDAGAWPRLLARLHARLVPLAFAAEGARDAATVPSMLAMVSELHVPHLGAIAAQSFGALVFLVAWFGMLLLLLPRRRWQAGHFAVLSASALLYRYLLTAAGLGRTTLVALLALPLLAALIVDLRDGDADDIDDVAAALPLVVWLLVALLMSYQAVRFILLLAAPLGIAAGVAVGRFYETVDAEARARPAWAGALPRALLVAAVLALAFEPLRIGRATAANYLPAMDRAWADSLTQLRDTTPPDTIVFTWWDYGYWTKYFAERRVAADGGTLLTNVPLWLARAQLAPSEAQSVGLLRMLACGSDADPYPEGAASARAALQRAGLGEPAAIAAIDDLAGLDRAAADAYLARRGLDAPARDAVLAATHCQPPPGVLLLSNAQLGLTGWWQVAAWEPRRAAAVALRDDPEAIASARLVDGFGLTPEAAAVLARAPRGLDDAARARFVAPQGRLLTADWVDCPLVDGGERRCPIGVADADGVVEAVRYPADDARQARVERRAGGTLGDAPPALLRVAEGAAVETVAGTLPADAVGVLIDADAHRVLVGTPNAIAATYVQLMFLDGRGLSRFRKLDDRSGAFGRRVTSWAIDWHD